MEQVLFGWYDGLIFLTFFLVIVAFSMYKSRKEKTGEDYFLASRGLTWPLIGLSMIAANISTEQFVGMSGQGAGSAGLAIASYEWMAAITMVIVAIYLLPHFLKAGIYTFPEFLEYRYSPAARNLMAFYTVLIYVFVLIASVVYTGALTITTLFAGIKPLGIEVTLTKAVWLVGVIAAIYTIWGGLKSIVWADLFFGSSLIIGGIVTLIIGFGKVGGIGSFFEVNQDKLHMILPADHPVLPWTALVFGLWLPNFYYWSVNQFITQRTLAAKSLKEGQKGVIFAASLKLITPFIIIFPGIMAWQLFKDQMSGPGGTDAAFPLIIRNIIPTGFKGFIFAAIGGAVISSLASMLNSASTIFTMDIYKRMIGKDISQKKIINTGRISTFVFLIIGCLIAPNLANPALKGIFTYLQEFQGFISPGILAAFAFGMIFKRAPKAAGISALVLNPIIYGILLIFCGSLPVFEKVQIVQIAFLNRMAITFIIIVIVMAIITLLKPLDKPVTMPERKEFDMQSTPVIKWLGAAVIVAVVMLYII
ncbi:MAG: solute:sodium symporter family transporter, partial [Candidatus Marinimicrobia bacterium]|nr:solute:sodium symporter family transporter [Candidatus Neomarinimicrobiota bacterium]